uniref:VP2 n=1 Tax=Equine encephalosis virus 7 TaxID=201496 RepID=A0A7U1BCL3_9REOV|nr:VP2 [Equine encephalosis virus 7]
MDFRVLICDDTHGVSRLTTDDLETFQDETTIICRIGREHLDNINDAVERTEFSEWQGEPIQKGWPEAPRSDLWPKGLTSFDTVDSTVPITEALKLSTLRRETSSTQLASLKYGKIMKELSKRGNRGSNNKWGVEASRYEEHVSLLCQQSQQRDIMLRDIFSSTQNRVRVTTLVGVIDMPGWLDGSYSLVRESKHAEVCKWGKLGFMFYQIGVLNLYESFKYTRSKYILSQELSTVTSDVKKKVQDLRRGIFERRKFEELRLAKGFPKCKSGTDKEATENVIYSYLGVYMKLLQVSCHDFLETERSRIMSAVDERTSEGSKHFDRFRATGNSTLLFMINKILNIRDDTLRIERSRRDDRGYFFFDTRSAEYQEWMMAEKRKGNGFSTMHYAEWIMNRDNQRLRQHLSVRVHFANFLRAWRVIPRGFVFPNSYDERGINLRLDQREELFNTIFEFFKTRVAAKMFMNTDDQLFAEILEMTLRTSYANRIPKCRSEDLSSFVKVLMFSLTDDKKGEVYSDYREEIDDESSPGVFWEAVQSSTEPISIGIRLTESSIIGCEEYLKRLLLDPTHDAGTERDVLVGEADDVHGDYPESEITGEWIVVRRFVGYKYRLTLRAAGAREGVRLCYAEAMSSPQAQYLRHNTLMLGGCRSPRERIHDRTYSNRMRLFSPGEGMNEHPCYISKIIDTNDRGIGSLLVFYLYRYIDWNRLVVEIARRLRDEPMRFPQEFLSKMKTDYPEYEIQIEDYIKSYERRGAFRFPTDMVHLLMNPSNCYVLDVSIDEAMLKWFGLKMGMYNFFEVIRTSENKARQIEDLCSSISFTGTNRDYFMWNIIVTMTNLFVPEFMEFKRNVPFFVLTNKKILPVPIRLQTYTEGNVGTNAFRYMDGAPDLAILNQPMTQEGATLLRNLMEHYLKNKHWVSSPSKLEGRYSVFQSWVGMGCQGIKEKIEILIPTARPSQSHFKVIVQSEVFQESDIGELEAVLDEGYGLGGVDVVVEREKNVSLNTTGLRVKRYKHLVHDEMIDGIIVKLDAASRFDTYMTAKLLN